MNEIILKKLKWGNWFSYGEDNEIILDNNPLTQIKGINGAGKSSINLILEETLYNKNSKGIKKADIVNRETPGNPAWSNLTFSVNDVPYEVFYERKGASTKLSLIKDGEDISSHTATGTFKQLEAILGRDFKMYSALTYQSSNTGLQFLKATDTERKKFLISLFNLDDYLTQHENFKNKHKTKSLEVAKLSGELKSSADFVNEYSSRDLEISEEVMGVPEYPRELEDGLVEIKATLSNAKKLNESINKNNTYKEKLAEIPESKLTYTGNIPDKKALQDLTSEIAVVKSETSKLEKEKKELEEQGKEKVCSSCKQLIPAKEVKSNIQSRVEQIEDNKQKLESFTKQQAVLKKEVDSYIIYKETCNEFERLSNFIDTSLPEEIVSTEELLDQISSLEKEINSIKATISEAEAFNRKVEDKNTKAKVILEELEKHKAILKSKEGQVKEAQEKLAILQVLKDSFSTTGLVTYKLEFVVQTLEEEINRYLAELSSGRFMLQFSLDKDKLNIEIIDEGDTIAITALSSGELARVNTATLLAIRNLMSNISKTKVNLLFLDEIMGVLDENGKDTLISLLLNENLNTFLVSHEYEHPLVPSLTITKEDNISKIENG